ncbi:MAG: hypothetical protein JRJ76_16845 [Deltaproteobacteria bacterium]|nr:hypothetical protein [Deltaproteobacteria bacterium]
MNILQKKIMLSTLLKLQLFYCFLGIGYNIVSYILAMSGGRQLSSTSPVIGTIFMSVYGLCLMAGYKGFYKTYRLLMLFFLVSSGYGGVIKHFIVYSQQPEAYASFSAWISAIGINFFGFLLNLMAVAGRFEDESMGKLSST